MKTATVPHHNILVSQTVDQPLWQHILLLAVLGYEAAGALAGGTLLIAAPDGHYMDMRVDIMHGAFNDFFIPGILLLALGMLNAIGFVSVLRRSQKDWLMASLALGGLLIWFVTEIIVLQQLHWLHAMWAIPVLAGAVVTISLIALRNNTDLMNRGLLFCGMLSSLWYIAINIYVPLQYDGYNITTFTVSELSAIDAPTRILWVLLELPYPLLFAAFGWGLLMAATGNRYLRITGGLIIAYCFFNLYWPPMHMRGNEAGLTDTLHIAWAIITNIFMWLFMISGAAASGKKFRIYTVVSIGMHIVFGALAFLEAPDIVNNAPTPMIGIWERINIGIFILWVAVFAIVLLNKRNAAISIYK